MDFVKQMEKDWNAPFKGWDFSYIKNRTREEKPPWSYEKIAKKLVRESSSILDMGTGGGEIFSLLAPFPKKTVATEGWKPNIAVAKKRLKPLGVKVVPVTNAKLPFKSGEFELVLNRHEAFDAKEVFRVMKPGGTFLTQQVGGRNLKDFGRTFGARTKYKNWTFADVKNQIRCAGFTIKFARLWRGKIEFKDVGAIVYFIKAVPWSAPDFGIKKSSKDLEKLQKRLESGGKLRFTQVRYLIEARKI